VCAGAFEFADTEAFLEAGEAIAVRWRCAAHTCTRVCIANSHHTHLTARARQGPYVWGRYDLLLLPPSFPYGGMENPCLARPPFEIKIELNTPFPKCTHPFTHPFTHAPCLRRRS
jgi:hypothetical protein